MNGKRIAASLRDTLMIHRKLSGYGRSFMKSLMMINDVNS